jgi:hypothetical protein
MTRRIAPDGGFRWPGIAGSGSLLLPIPRALWAPPAEAVSIDGMRFAPKTELHVTLLGRAKLQALYRGRLDRRQVRDALRRAFCACDWAFARTGRLSRLEKRRPGGARVGSIIEAIEQPALAAFVARLVEATGVVVAAGPPHVTLYACGDPRGIGVEDEDALHSLTVRELDSDELRPAR